MRERQADERWALRVANSESHFQKNLTLSKKCPAGFKHERCASCWTEVLCYWLRYAPLGLMVFLGHVDAVAPSGG
jgi:hypothetical protein